MSHGEIAISAALILGLMTAVPLAAQERRGFSVGLSGGYGSADATCDGCGAADREHGVAGGLTLGWALNPRVVLGASLDFWTKEERDRRLDVTASVNLYNLSGTVTLYPSATAGLFVRGGIGAAMVDNEVRSPRSRITYDLGTGVGAVAAVGYDIRAGRHLNITPAFHVWYGRPGDLTVLHDTLVRDFRFNVAALTVGFIFH